jgi:uncharacterized membrane protein
MRRRTNYVIQLILKRWWAVFGLAVLASFVLVLFLGKGQSIWFDENYSVILAKQPVLDLIKQTGVDAHPPRYYLLLKGWGHIFGWSELALRSLSAVLAALTVGVVAMLIRRLFTVRVALISLPFLIFAPFWLRYGYEVRMYALAGLIGALGSWALARAVDGKTDRKRWTLYMVAVAAGMYTLYMTAVVWLAHFVWLLIYYRRRFWRQPWFLAYVGSVVLFLPYLATAIYQYTHSALPGVGEMLNLTHIGELASMLLIYTPEWSVNQWTALGIIVEFILWVYVLDRARHQMTVPARRSLGFVLCLAVVPFVFFVLISLPMDQPFFLPRYLTHTILFDYALIGIAVGLGWRYGYRKAAVGLFVLSAVLLGWGMGQLVHAGNFNYERMQRPETKQVRQLVDCTQSTIVADDAYTYINDSYYFDGCDMRFYSALPLPYEGGYAWLSYQKTRIANPNDVTAKYLVYLRWKDAPQNFQPDSRYRLVSSVTDDFQVTDTYKLISE